MTVACAQLVDVSLARRYQCISRCVRRAFSLEEGDHNCKEWLESRLEELVAGSFLGVHLRQVAADRQTPQCAALGQPERLSASMMRP
jgi:hypothetical protein